AAAVTLRGLMARRTNQRRDAVFALYQSDLTGQGLDDLLGRSSSPYTHELDVLISRYSEGWTIDRIAPLERAILRTALLEMLHPDVVPADSPIPPEGAISEAVELAKTFAGAQSPGFVNGILAAVLREMSQTA